MRFRTHKYTGPVVVHCHLQSDADQGMMMTTEIVDEGERSVIKLTSVIRDKFLFFQFQPQRQRSRKFYFAL